MIITLYRPDAKSGKIGGKERNENLFFSEGKYSDQKENISIVERKFLCF